MRAHQLSHQLLKQWFSTVALQLHLFCLNNVFLYYIQNIQVTISNGSFKGLRVTEQIKLLDIDNIIFQGHAFKGIKKFPRQLVSNGGRVFIYIVRKTHLHY